MSKLAFSSMATDNEHLSKEHQNAEDSLTNQQILDFISNNPDVLKLIKEKMESELNKKENCHFNNDNPPIKKDVVIDTSVCGIGGILTLLNLQENVFVPDVVIRKLKDIKTNKVQSQSTHAKLILHNIFESFENYIVVNVDTTEQTGNEAIINYCDLNKKSIVLLTADIEMAALSKGRGINVCFLERRPIKFPIIDNDALSPIYNEIGKTITLEDAEYSGGRLAIILNGYSHKKRICVFSGRKEFMDGRFVLKVGHEVFIAKKKDDYISFFHFIITSITKRMNCKIVYCAKIKNENAFHFLPDSRERQFMRNFYAN